MDRHDRCEVAGSVVEVVEQQLPLGLRNHFQAACQACRILLKGIDQLGNRLTEVGGNPVRIDAIYRLRGQRKAIGLIGYGNFDRVVGTGFGAQEMNTFLLLAHVLDVFPGSVHQITVTAIEDHGEHRQRCIHCAAALRQGQWRLLVGQQAAELLVGVLNDIAHAVLLQANTHRQGVDEHAQRMVGTGGALGTSRKHGTENPVVAAAGGGYHQAPCRMEQHRGRHALSPCGGVDPRAEIVAQILHRTQDCCIAATHIEHAVRRSGGIDIPQQLTEVGFMFGLGHTRGLGDEVAVRLRWRQGVGASVHHCLDLAHDQAQGDVVADKVMVQQRHQPLFLPGIVGDIRGYQRCLLQVQAHMVGIGAFAQHLQGVFTRCSV